MASRTSSRRRSRVTSHHPIVAFLLVACFGILFAGCLGPEDVEDDTFTFTEDDVARYRELAENAQGSGTGSAPFLEPLASGSGRTVSGDTIEIDLSLVSAYNGLREGVGGGSDMFQVTNEFLNVRGTPSTGGANLARLEFGDSVEVLSFENSTWAKIKTSAGIEGYVSHRYLSKTTSEERLEAEKKEYENTYYVSFAFVNIRKEANQASEKLGEIPGGTIVEPISIEGDWAKVNYDGIDGYVSASYLASFIPNFVVRQETYELPVLHYNMRDDQTAELLTALTQHVNALRADGYKIITMKQFYDVLLSQQRRDVRLEPKNVVVAISGITPENVRQVSDALNTSGVNATLFIETRHLGLSGITEKQVITLLANGFDLQSAAHSGDDLRSLTNAQVELELKQSRKILEEYTKRTVFAISYPQSATNDRVAQLAAEAGYLIGLTDQASRTFTRGQLLRIPGMMIFPSMSAEEVTEFVSGS